jgi:gluconate kinase
MPSSLLQSQMETLEPPGHTERAWRYGIDQSPQAIVDDVVKRMGNATTQCV